METWINPSSVFDQVQFNLRSVFPSKKISKQKLKFRNKP